MRLVILIPGLFFSFAALSQTAAGIVQAADEFEKSIASGKQLILDVRTDKEFRTGHIASAMLANWNDTAEFSRRVQYIDHQQPVYIYCLAGGRSTAAARWMRSRGFVNVVELEGGINAWKNAGKPLVNPVAVKQITLAEFLGTIPGDKTVLVDIGADWCPPCRKMQPVIARLQKDRALHFELKNIDAGEQTQIQQELGIKLLPVFIIYKNGKEVWRGEGTIAEAELKKQLN